MKKTFSMIAVSVVFSFLILQVALPGGALAASGISNPLKGINSIQDFISVVLKFFVNLLAIAGVLYIIWTGFLFVKAQGNPSELTVARKSFLNAVIGMAIILGAWSIATLIANTINGITSSSSSLKL